MLRVSHWKLLRETLAAVAIPECHFRDQVGSEELNPDSFRVGSAGTPSPSRWEGTEPHLLGTAGPASPLCPQIQPQEISPPPTANLDRSNDKVYENVTGLVKAVIEMSSKIQPAPPEEYVPMVKVRGQCLESGFIPSLNEVFRWYGRNGLCEKHVSMSW